MKNLFHKHDYNISERSNVIQLDDMGYPLRLCILKCCCGLTQQAWPEQGHLSILAASAVPTLARPRPFLEEV